MSTITHIGGPRVRAARTERRRAVTLAENASKALARMGKPHEALRAAAIATFLNDVRKDSTLTGLQKDAIFRAKAETFMEAA